MTDLFRVYVLNDRGIDRASEIIAAFDELLEKLEIVCPEGREMSIVKTKLQEASFFAKRAMALDPENHHG